MPRHDGAARQLVDAQPRAGKNLVDRQPALAHHLRERLRIGAVRRLLLRRDGARRGVEGDERAVLRLDQRQAGRQRLPALGESVGAGEIEHEHARLRRRARERPRQVGDAHGLRRHVAIPRNRCIDRDEIVLALELQAAPGEIDEDHRLRPRRIGFLQKFAEGAARLVLIEIGGAGDIEAGIAQRLGDQAGIVGGGGEGTHAVLGIAEDERDPRLRCLRAGWRDEGEREDEGEDRASDRGFQRHFFPNERAAQLRPGQRTRSERGLNGWGSGGSVNHAE